MKVKSEKPKGQRVFKSCFRKTKRGKVTLPFWIEPVGISGDNWWFDLVNGYWFNDTVEERNDLSGCTTSYYAMKHHGYRDVYSLKAVKRLIQKWDVPKGTKFYCSTGWVGFNFIVTK